jgi:membrane protease YdiL (CAAX protease family)
VTTAAVGEATTGGLPTPTGSDALWTVVGGMGGMVAGLVVGAVPALLVGGPGYVAIGVATAAAGGAGGLWAALVRRRGWGLRELGFVRGARSLWHLLWEVPAALTAGLLATVSTGALLGLAPDEGGGSDDSLLTSTFLAAPWSLVVAVVCVVLLVPAVEEVVFRRVLLGWVRTRVPTPVAVLLVSGVFGALHVVPTAVLYLFFLGVSAALLFLWHRSLWAPIALHAVNNALASLVGVLALTS